MNEKAQQVVRASIRSLATLVPGSSVFVQAWSEYESFQSNQRIEGLMQTFHENIRKQTPLIVEEKVRAEFPVLLERIIEKVRREPSEIKRTYYADLLSKAFTINKATSIDEKINAIESLDQLTEEDLKLLKSFSTGSKMRVDHFVPKSQFYQFPPELEEQVGKLIISLQKLESRGLISPTSGDNEAFEYIGERTDWINQWRAKTYIILPFGKTFCALIWE